MLSLTSDYHVRLLELQGIKTLYVPRINGIMREWNNSHIPWAQDVEEAFEWLVIEAVSQVLNCSVHQHYQSDLGKYLINQLPGIVFDMQGVIDPIFKFVTLNRPKHLKVMVLGNILIVGILL